MDYVELKYSRLVSSYLTGWKDVGNGLTRFRCPFCGDSQKSKSKTRGYFYEIEGKCNFKCHNCGASMSLLSFLSEIAPALAKDYKFEKFSKKSLHDLPDESIYKTDTESVFESRTLLDRYCVSIASLDSDHPARQYLEGRQLPETYFTDLYYTDHVLDIMGELPEYRDAAKQLRKRDAIVIPFYDEQKKLMCIQFRFFEGDLRYMTLKVADDAMKIWGLDRIDWNARVYVVEGSFDAMFIPNCIAVAGASILSVIKYVESKAQKDLVLIFDKDYRVNYEVYTQFAKAIALGHKIVMFDPSFEAKDINAQIQDFNWTIPRLLEYIEKRTFSGLMAKLELSKIRPPQKRKYGKEVYETA